MIAATSRNAAAQTNVAFPVLAAGILRFSTAVRIPPSDCVNAKLIALFEPKQRQIRALMSLNSDFPVPTGTRSRTARPELGHQRAESRSLTRGGGNLASKTSVIRRMSAKPGFLVSMPALLDRLTEYLSRTSKREATLIDVTRQPEMSPATLDAWRRTVNSGAILVLVSDIGLVRVLRENGLAPGFLGYAPDDGAAVAPAVFTVHDQRLPAARREAPAAKPPLAILSTYNDEDCVQEVATSWLRAGCDLHAIDNWSTDGTHGILERLCAQNPGSMTIERFPDEPARYFRWEAILGRKEQIAAAMPGRWIFHTDSDEVRTSPWPGVSIAAATQIVERYGANRIDFTLLNFRPTKHHYFRDKLTDLKFFEYGTRPGHFIQKKAWLQGSEPVNLIGSGGHVANFAGAVDFPYKFVLKHYPIRSAEHGRRKIFVERKPRWDPCERAMGSHVQYDDVDETTPLVWNAAELRRFSDETLRRDLALLISDLSRSP